MPASDAAAAATDLVALDLTATDLTATDLAVRSPRPVHPLTSPIWSQPCHSTD